MKLFEGWWVWSSVRQSPYNSAGIVPWNSIPLLRLLSIVSLGYPRYPIRECQSLISWGLVLFFGCGLVELAIISRSEVCFFRRTYCLSMGSAYSRISPLRKIWEGWEVIRNDISNPYSPSRIVLIRLKPKSGEYQTFANFKKPLSRGKSRVPFPYDGKTSPDPVWYSE